MRIHSRLLLGVPTALSAMLALLAPPTAVGRAAFLPPGFMDLPVAGGLAVPTALAFLPEASPLTGPRFLIAQKNGVVRLFQAGALLQQPALTLAVQTNGEQGLLGLAIDPDFPVRPFVYACYTPFTGRASGNYSRVSRFTLSGDTLEVASEQVLLDSISAGLGTHVAGCVRASSDGYLFVSTGEHGDGGSAPQDPLDLSGKLLRLRLDGSIPADNPFVGHPWGRPEVYQLGLRNPFRFALHAGSGAPFIADVGASAFEEVDTGGGGANFGWPLFEGAVGSSAPFVAPWFAYPHEGGAAIVGVTFLTRPQLPEQYQGNLFFFDHIRCALGRIALGEGGTLGAVEFPFLTVADAQPGLGPIDLAEGTDGALYYTTGAGEVRRLVFRPGNRAPIVAASALPNAGDAPLTVQFDCRGTRDPDAEAIALRWDFGDGDTSAVAFPSHTYLSNGDFHARLTAWDAQGAISWRDSLRIVVGDLPPVPTIDAPASESRFVSGGTIAFAGHADDREQGALPPAQLRWRVERLYAGQTSVLVDGVSGATGSFVADVGEGAPLATRFRVSLTATDAIGLSASAARIVLPDSASFVGVPGADEGARLALTAFPNPLGSHSALRFTLRQSAPVRLVLFDASGRRVRTLVVATLPAGEQAIRWDGRHDDGHNVPPGLYLARLEVGDAVAHARLVRLAR